MGMLGRTVSLSLERYTPGIRQQEEHMLRVSFLARRPEEALESCGAQSDVRDPGRNDKSKLESHGLRLYA